MRWPPAWKDGVLLRSTPINCLLGAPALNIEGVAALNSPPADVTVLPGKWARIRAGQGGSGSAGPTGKPWVESNGWRVQLERTLQPGREIWVDAQPPTGQVLPAAAYLLMTADAEAFGARWIVSLDESLSKKVADGESAAVESWKALTAALRFFGDHRQWSTYETIASAGVISDFAGGNRFLSHELLNLAARRAMPVRILPKAGAVSADWTGLRALVFIETARPAAGEQLQSKLTKFVEGGGLLIAPERMIANAAAREPRHGYSVWSHGKGTVYVPEKPWTDPWQLTADVHLLAGRDLDVLRLYNAASVNIVYTQSQDGARGVVQIVNYSTRAPASGITVALRKKWKRARLLGLETPNGTPLTIETSRYGVEVPLPAFPVYAAIELEA